MKEMLNPFFNIRLFFIRLFKGEHACDEAIINRACRNLARQIQSQRYPGYVAKRKLARALDHHISYIGDIAGSLGIESVTINRTLYYRLKDTIRILKSMC